MQEPRKSQDARQSAPATQRNREPILSVLRQVLPSMGTVLEVSSGTGEHAVFFAPHLHPRQWIPSDPNPIARESIAAWKHYCAGENLAGENLLPPIALDARDAVWPVEQADFRAELQEPITAIVNINMIHIAPWEACLGLMAGAGRILPPGGVLYLYGPFRQEGKHTAPSNATFDQSLQRQNPEWGVRDLADVRTAAQAEGLTFQQIYPMPANNLSMVFQKE
ncbi:DUF938 domain-containing protein [Egbenema bharatensis]|uniref:DUF938 domain-containing protein n=1 Tax=Egbenema bharatensis TaxID=3463334 RepID=UPI003A88E3F7